MSKKEEPVRGCEKIVNALPFASFSFICEISKSLTNIWVENLEISQLNEKSIKSQAIANFFTASA